MLNDISMFKMLGFSSVVCKNSKQQWLVETNKQTGIINFPKFKVDSQENFVSVIQTEMFKIFGSEMNITGVLRVEYNIKDDSQELTAIFYMDNIKSEEILETTEVKHNYKWIEKPEFEQSSLSVDYTRESHVYYWMKYVENGGIIYPLSCLQKEDNEIKLIAIEDLNQTDIVVTTCNYDKENILSSFEKSLNLEDETWFTQINARYYVNNVYDKKGNNLFQISCLRRNVSFIEDTLVLMNEASLLSKNANNETILHSLLYNVNDSKLVKLVITKILSYLNQEKVKKLIQLEDNSKISCQSLLNTLIMKSETGFLKEYILKQPILEKLLTS